MKSAKRREWEAILFDWDGTVVDTYHSTYRAYSQSLAEFGIELSPEEFSARYTPHWNHFYSLINLHADHWERASEKWQYYFEQESITLMPGAHAVLERLKREGFRLGIVTATSRDRLTNELTVFGLAPLFDLWICNEDTTHKKPHPEALQTASGRLQIPPAECLYVGDAVADVEMARRCGMASCAIPSKFNTVDDIERSRPDYVLTNIAELPRLIGGRRRRSRRDGDGNKAKGRGVLKA